VIKLDFKIGDKVIVLLESSIDDNTEDLLGKTGIIIGFEGMFDTIAIVQFDTRTVWFDIDDYYGEKEIIVCE